MIRTVVCTKNKCSGNRFYIESVDNRLKATCKECGSIYYFDIKKEDFIMLPSCSKCNNNIFKKGSRENLLNNILASLVVNDCNTFSLKRIMHCGHNLKIIFKLQLGIHFIGNGILHTSFGKV